MSQKEGSVLDERYLEGRRRRILEEHDSLEIMNEEEGAILIVGSGYMSIECACDLKHYFPRLRITLTDFLPRCLGPLPENVAAHCEEHMQSIGIKTVYGIKYDPNRNEFWQRVGLPRKADRTYILSGVSHSNYMMPKQALSDFGPGGGGWILINKQLQVIQKNGDLFGGGAIFAIGDCNVGSVGERNRYEVPPIPKTGYPAEEQAVHAARNIKALDRNWYGAKQFIGPFHLPGTCWPSNLRGTWRPWGADIYAISLGPKDGCIILSGEQAKHKKWLHGHAAVAIKELIESTKIAQCRGDHHISKWFWNLVHHWPVNLWGQGPLLS